MSMVINERAGNGEARPWIGGACAGLAARAGIRPWIPRAGAVLLLLIHPVFMLLFYAAAAMLLRRDGASIGRPGWFGGPRWFRRWPSRNRAPRGPGWRAPKEPPSPLAGIGSRLAALDRRLDALEAAMGGPDEH